MPTSIKIRRKQAFACFLGLSALFFLSGKIHPISHVPKILTPNFHHDIIILLKSSRKLSITKTPLAATKGVFLYLLKALRLDYLSPLFRHLRISHSAISSATTLTNNGSKTSSRKLYSITSHLPLAQYSECDCLIIS